MRSEGNNELFVWLVDFPWPIFDREYVIRRRLDRHDDGGAASISRVVNDSGALLSEDPGNVRIKDFVQLAAARPLPQGGGVSFQLLYRNDLHAPIPQWLITWFSTLAVGGEPLADAAPCTCTSLTPPSPPCSFPRT